MQVNLTIKFNLKAINQKEGGQMESLFFREIAAILNPTNFPMFVAIYLMVKVSKSIDKLTAAVRINCQKIQKFYILLSAMMEGDCKKCKEFLERIKKEECDEDSSGSVDV